jgi:hypothetical protein
MMHFIKHKIIVAFVVSLLCGVTTIFACDCPRISMESAVKNSSIILSGKILGFEYRKGIPDQRRDSSAAEMDEQIDYETLVVRVQVEQWWKGNAPTEIFLITDILKFADGTSRRSSCDYNFLSGESYLIFAAGKENEYRTSECSRTRKLTLAKDDLKILGEGKKPIKSEDEPTNS